MTGPGQPRQPRALTPQEEDKFRTARLGAVELMPYFARGLFALQPAAVPGLDTFGVDSHWRLYMDPGLLADPAAAAGLLLHEVNHLLRDHFGRAGLLPGPVNHLALNLAEDAEINDGLLDAGVPLPGRPVTPAALGLPDGLLAEEYYERLLARAPAGGLARFDDGGPGCGSGSGGPPLPCELPWETGAGLPGDPLGVPPGEPVTALPGLGGADADMIRNMVALDVMAAPGQGRGTMPAGLSRWASAVLAPPVVPWTEVLRGAVRAAVTDAAGQTSYTYRRLPRRRVPGVILPALRGVSVTAAIVIDTSGSMSQARLDAAMSEVGGVLAAAGISRDRLCVLACDAAAAAPQRVTSVSGIRLAGGGGTDMRVGIAAAAALRPEPDVVIVVTDGLTPWPEHPVRPRLVCAVISPAAPRDTPPWAVTVHIPEGPPRRHPPARAAAPELA